MPSASRRVIESDSESDPPRSPPPTRKGRKRNGKDDAPILVEGERQRKSSKKKAEIGEFLQFHLFF